MKCIVLCLKSQLKHASLLQFKWRVKTSSSGGYRGGSPTVSGLATLPSVGAGP